MSHDSVQSSSPSTSPASVAPGHAGHSGTAGPWAVLEQRAHDQPDAFALRSKLRGLWRAESWSAWRDGAARLAAMLTEAGVRQGDRVAVVLPEETAWFHAALATAALGAMLVVLPEAAAGGQVLAQVRALDCRVLVTRRSDLLALASSPAFGGQGRRVMSPGTVQFAQPSAFAKPAADRPFSAILVQANDTTRRVEEEDLLQALGVLRQQLPLQGSHLVVGCDIASLTGLAARLLLPLVEGVVACLPEPGVDFFDTLRDVEPEVVIATTAQWEAIWREVGLRRLEAAPLHQWLFDRAVQVPGRARWSPLALVQSSLRRQLGLRRCRVAASVGAPLSGLVSQWYASFGPSLLQSGPAGAVPLESDLRSLPVVRDAQTRVAGAPGEVDVELTLDIDAALRFASVHGLDCDHPAALGVHEGLRRLVETELRQLCTRRAGPRVRRVLMQVDGVEPRSDAG